MVGINLNMMSSRDKILANVTSGATT